jgi:ferric-dicitrate binding protein FerR (iron transport regulator)
LLHVLSPLGVQASLAALEERLMAEDGSRGALRLQREQLDYEAQRAFEQYNEADPRNRLVAAELERRWNEKLEQVEAVRAGLAPFRVAYAPATTRARHAGWPPPWASTRCTPGCCRARSFRIPAGSCSAAISRSRPPQCGHARTSKAKERFSYCTSRRGCDDEVGRGG